jgi:hypothetical protein
MKPMNSIPTNNSLSSPAALTSSRRPVHLNSLHTPRWALAAALALGTLGSAHAQTLVRSADLYVSMIGSTNHHALQLVAHEGDVLKVNYETDFNYGYAYIPWESVAWVPFSGARVSAAMAGMNEFLEPIQDRGLTINNLTVSNVDLNMGNVQLMFHPPTASPNASIALTLNNGSLGGGFRTPLLWTPSPFLFNVTGDSQIGGWLGTLRSVTTLDVASGATLRIKDCGSVTGTTLSQKLYFGQLNNTAVINGGSLIIDNSAVVFGQDPHDLNANQSTMSFLNNATLQILGPSTTPKLETDRVVLQNSSLNMANNTLLKARNLLELDNSTAVIGDGAVANVLQVIAKGASTATLTHHAGSGANSQGIVTSFLQVHDGATFTLAGTGEMGVNGAVDFPSSGFGAIRVTQNANLWLTNTEISLGSRGSLTTERAATNESGGVTLTTSSMSLNSAGTFINNGWFSMDEDSVLNVLGHATIGGTGFTEMDGKLFFAAGLPASRGKSSLSTGNQIGFGMNSMLTLTLDPTAQTSDRLILSNLVVISYTAALDLQVVNDTALAQGTKFVLMDYRGPQATLGSALYFVGYPNGHTFTLGLNSYKINYRDSNYLPGSSQFVTLTVVANADCRVLNLSHQGGNALLWWSAACANFQLESTYSLGPKTVVWTPVPGSPVLIGGLWVASVPIETTNRFFRLHMP